MTRANPFDTRLRTARVTIRFTPQELAEIQDAAQRLHSRSYTHVNVGRYIRNRALNAAREANKEALQKKSDNALEQNVSQSFTPARTKVRQRSRSDNPPRGPR